MRKALAGIFAVVILLLFGGLSFNHANLKQHDIISSRNFIEVKPGKGYMWLDLAQSYLAHSQPELAETALHKVQAVSTENEKNILLLKIELAKGNLIVARGLFDEYISAGLDEDTRKLYKCQLSAREGDLEGAEEQCGHDFSDPTMKAAALNQLGALYLKKGNEWDGEMALRRAYESDGFYPGVLTNLGFLFERQGKKDEALGFYMRAVRIDPFSIIARKHAARILHGQGKFSEQVRLLEEIIRINPYEVEAHANLALTLILKFKKPDEARFHLEEALRLAPDSPMAAELMRLGQYYYSLQSD
jgi:tetratricopeptide (TPR) repeat protein